MSEKRQIKPQMNDIRNVIIKALVGALTGVVLFFVMSAVAAFALWKTDSNSGMYQYILLAIGAVSALVCGFVAVRPVRKNGIAVGALSVLPAYLVTILVSILVSKSGVGLFGWILLAVQVVFSAIGGIIAVNKRK
ncbi:MAG: TIGR04086 family membrane protein [Clostridia bacterium]|nr:TIGR04086 family membrane protein [Clostridia bacterium]